MNNYCMPSNTLVHHGIMGQRWGVRRYQNEDGSLTTDGKKRYTVKGKGYNKKQHDDKSPTVERKNRYSGKELKQINKERGNIRDEYMKKDPRNKELKRLEKQAYKLADDYDFDMDDGGGGSTEADQEAGKKYLETWDEYSYVHDQIESDANKKATEKIIDTYGQTAVDQLEMRNNIQAVAVVSAMLAVPTATLIWAFKTTK